MIYKYRKWEKKYTFIPTSLFRDRSLFRRFNDKNIQNHRLYTFRLHSRGKFKFKCLVVTSIGGGFLVDLKPYVSLEEVDTSGLRKKYAFQRILRRNCSVFSIRRCKKSFCDGRGIFFVEYPMLNFSIAEYRRVLDNS